MSSPDDLRCRAIKLSSMLAELKLLSEACGEGVNFSPGKAFFPDGRDGDRCLRLNLAMQRPEEIEEGIRRLGAAMKRYAVSRVRDSKNSA